MAGERRFLAAKQAGLTQMPVVIREVPDDEMLEWALDQEESVPLARADRVALLQEIADDVLGYGPIDPFLSDSDITEVMVNGPHQVWVERAGRLSLSETRFVDATHLERIIEKIVGQVGRRIDESTPMVDARLSDGSRVNVIIPPLSLDGAILTIRKFAKDPFTARDLVAFAGVRHADAEQALEFLQPLARIPHQQSVTRLQRDGWQLGDIQPLAALNPVHP